MGRQQSGFQLVLLLSHGGAKKLEPKETREGRPRKVALDALAEDVRLYPDAYQYERAERFGVAPNAIFVALKKLDLTYKKKPHAPQGGRRRTAHLPRDN